MTDPVRPRDYVWLLNEAKSRVRRSVLWKRFIDGTPLENDIAVWMADLASEAVDLAAAPVPCAASPADVKLVCDAAQQHYGDERIWANVHGPAYFNANMGRAENRRKLGEAIQRLRATGEGARDEQDGQPQSGAECGPDRGASRTAAEQGELHSLRARVRSGEPTTLHHASNAAASVGAEALCRQESAEVGAPVAVSLDPRRLLTVEEIDFLLAHTRQLFENQHRHGERVETCDAPGCVKFRDIRARLRGEATVRVEDKQR